MKYSTGGQFEPSKDDKDEINSKFLAKYGPEEQDSEYDQEYLDKKRAE